MTPIELWLHHTPGIEEALHRGGDARTVADVAAQILDNEAQVWGDERALIVTELLHPYVHFWIATGEMDAVMDLSHEIMAWAKGLGYTKASLTGRRGWVRALAGEGWQETAVLMERGL